jgi:hypothetical protein
MNPVDKNNPDKKDPEILTNQGIDSTVVVSEPDRSVVLTPNETLVIDKEPQKIEVIRRTVRERSIGECGARWNSAPLAFRC